MYHRRYFPSLYLTCLQAALSSEKEIKHVLRELIQASKPISTTDVVRESENRSIEVDSVCCIADINLRII